MKKFIRIFHKFDENWRNGMIYFNVVTLFLFCAMTFFWFAQAHAQLIITSGLFWFCVVVDVLMFLAVASDDSDKQKRNHEDK